MLCIDRKAMRGIISLEHANSSCNEFRNTAPKRGSRGSSHNLSPKPSVRSPSLLIAFKVYNYSKERTRDYSGGEVRNGKSAILEIPNAFIYKIN